MTTVVAVGTVVLAACASSAAQSMRFESTPAPSLESRAVDALPFNGNDDGVEPRLVSEPAPSIGDGAGHGSAGADDTLLVGTPVSTAMAETNGIIEDAGATLVAHALVDRLVAHAGPGSDEIVVRLDNPTNHGGPLVLQAMTSPISTQIDFGWIEVLLPVRPNGTTGWIRTSDVDLSVNPYRIEVDVDDFTLTVFRNNAPYLTTPVGIGRGQTPTPEGSFYLAELLRPSNPEGIYGPYAYGLSGYSEVLNSFAGGEGVIGIHGTNEPWAIGTTVSHGCIRVDNTVIEALATFLPLGTPVDIGA
jgi:lipoprotein-anchoring transpeptidase ErfK/SrfK